MKVGEELWGMWIVLSFEKGDVWSEREGEEGESLRWVKNYGECG